MKRIEEALSEMGVKFEYTLPTEDTCGYVLIEFWTDTAGQDIPYEYDGWDGTAEDLVKDFVRYAENYDVDEEVELYANMRGQNGVPSTIRELLDDCQEAKDTLMKIAEKLQATIKEENIMANYRVYAKKGYDCFVDIKAESEDQAMEIAGSMSENDFTPCESDGLYIDYAEKLDEKEDEEK